MPATGSAIVCSGCSTSFVKTSSQHKYCTPECREAHSLRARALMKQEGIRECKGCQIWFKPVHHSRVYCDPECKHDHIIEAQREKRMQDRMMTPLWTNRCRYCGEMFERSYKHRTFCSAEHREEFFKRAYMRYYRRAGGLGMYSDVEESYMKMAKVLGYG